MSAESQWPYAQQLAALHERARQLLDTLASPGASSSVAESLDHATLQVEFWRVQQQVENLRSTHPDPMFRDGAYRARDQATKNAELWEKRAQELRKQSIYDLLPQIVERLDALENEGALLDTLATS